jgi:hypothetical protein
MPPTSILKEKFNLLHFWKTLDMKCILSGWKNPKEKSYGIIAKTG